MLSKYCSECLSSDRWLKVPNPKGNLDYFCSICGALQVEFQKVHKLEARDHNRLIHINSCLLARPHQISVGMIISGLILSKLTVYLGSGGPPDFPFAPSALQLPWEVTASVGILDSQMEQLRTNIQYFDWIEVRRDLFTQRRAAHAAMVANKPSVGASTATPPKVPHSPSCSVSDALNKVVNEWDHTDLTSPEELASLGDIIDEVARPHILRKD
jgi:hypothetical protein